MFESSFLDKFLWHMARTRTISRLTGNGGMYMTPALNIGRCCTSSVLLQGETGVEGVGSLFSPRPPSVTSIGSNRPGSHNQKSWYSRSCSLSGISCASSKRKQKQPGPCEEQVNLAVLVSIVGMLQYKAHLLADPTQLSKSVMQSFASVLHTMLELFCCYMPRNANPWSSNS